MKKFRNKRKQKNIKTKNKMAWIYLGKGKKIASAYPGVSIKKGDLKYLDKWGVAYDKDDLIFVTDNDERKPAYLGKGNSKKGFTHLMYYGSGGMGHKGDFEKKFNLDENYVPRFLKRAINTNQINAKKPNAHNSYDVIYQTKQGNVKIGYAEDGYIISAFPVKGKSKTNQRRKKHGTCYNRK